MSLPDPSTPLVTHVLVADNGHARLMRVVGPHKKRSIEQEELFESGTAKTRHGAATDHDAHTAEIQRFVALIAQHLESRHRAGALSNLILIAEPHVLGVMRARLPADVLHLISREISGDYAHADTQQLLRLVEDTADR
jgi:protein required for attachment to host cells